MREENVPVSATIPVESTAEVLVSCIEAVITGDRNVSPEHILVNTTAGQTREVEGGQDRQQHQPQRLQVRDEEVELALRYGDMYVAQE